jgi:hypothetical protein
MAGLLDPLTSQQQKLVDLVADAFLADDDWPAIASSSGSSPSCSSRSAA